jgi:hypothetical protein
MPIGAGTSPPRYEAQLSELRWREILDLTGPADQLVSSGDTAPAVRDPAAGATVIPD